MPHFDQPAQRSAPGRLPTPGVTIRKRWLVAWGGMLGGYALLGKGFAYAGYPPLFVGEMVLGLGVVTALLAGRGRELWDSPVTWLLLAFAGWGVFRTAPYLSEYGADAARDAVLYGYAAFALVVPAVLMAEPENLRGLVRGYGVITKVLLVGEPVVTVLFRCFFADHPVWPGSGVPMFAQKEGDVLVHMAGVVAFWMSGLAGPVRWPWVLLLAINVGTMGALDRAGLMTFSIVVGMCACLTPVRPRMGIPAKLLGVAAVMVFGLWLTNLRVEVPGGKGREVSFEQFVTNLRSYVGDTGKDGMDSTKEWRMDWWREIVRYTVDGPYFWAGKGFGVNLADDDGFQVLSTGTLRSPHNVSMTVLARMGVPGVALWGMVLAGAGVSVGGAYVAARRVRDERWCGVFLVIGSLTLACLINGSFDVFIEGPMGGIWFWSMVGLCLCAPWIYRVRRDVLEGWG